MSPARDDPALTSVSCLSDPVRRQLYDFVAAHPEPVGRDEAAAAAGIGRSIAVYHLDKLVESGLLTASYRRPEGRSGPGAGRPAKFYARSKREFTVTVPAREYELAAHLLARAVAADHGGASQAALRDAARRFGEDAAARHLAAGEDGDGDDAGRVAAVLRAHGFEPQPAADGAVVLRNCPFHRLAAEHRDIVCGMNLALIDGLVTGLGASGMRPALDPRPGQCCVVIGAGQPPAETATTGER
ncbi:MAG TPA: helix-turn-helix domain-containing protein [Streptosporangiaceae bacterium]